MKEDKQIHIRRSAITGADSCGPEKPDDPVQDGPSPDVSAPALRAVARLLRIFGCPIALVWIAVIYVTSLGTYGWYYDEPFYAAQSLDFYRQLVPSGADQTVPMGTFAAAAAILNRLPEVTMSAWSFDSGLPLGRAPIGAPLLLFKFDPVWSRVPFVIVTVLAVFYLSRYLRIMAGFFEDEGTARREPGWVREVSLITTVLLIAVSPTCFFQARFGMPQTISVLLLAMGCYAMAKGFVERRAIQTVRAMALFVAAMVLNYQNVLIAPFVVFSLLFFGLVCGRKVEAVSALVVFCLLGTGFVACCRDYLVSAFAINVTGLSAGSSESSSIMDGVARLGNRLNTIAGLLGVPVIVCVTAGLLFAVIGATRSGAKAFVRRSRFSIYAAGTGLTALTVPGLFLVSDNNTSAAKYLVDVLIVLAPVFLMAVIRIVGWVTASMSSRQLSPARVCLNAALLAVGVVLLIHNLGQNCVNRFAANLNYEAIMKEWIPVFYAGKEKGLVFGSDWYQHTFAFTGGGVTLSRDFAYVPAWRLPERPQGKYGAIRLVNDPSKDYWTDPALTFGQFDYARFLRERDNRLNALRPSVLSRTLMALGAFVALNALASVNLRRGVTRPSGCAGAEVSGREPKTPGNLPP